MDRATFKAAADLTDALTNRWYPHCLEAMTTYGIDTPERQARWVATMGHESAGFTATVESMNYSAQGLADTWPSRFAVDPKAKRRVPNALALSLHRKPEAIGNLVYGGRMGNGANDGYLYRGRGLPMLTGKAAYQAYSEASGIDYILDPQLLALDHPAAMVGGWFWKWKQANQYATFLSQQVAVNGTNPPIGWADRQKRLEIAANATGISLS